MNKKVFFAPMEGVTGYVFRNLFDEMFPGVSRYYTPFLSANHTHSFKSKEGRDIDPARNRVAELIPQILTNKASDFLWAADHLAEAGYTEMNLNLGCPSSTVTAKKKGAGFLRYPDELDAFFDEIFAELAASGNPIRVSVKTRLGVSDPAESGPLMQIFNRYPLCEVIIHARVREDQYKGEPRLDAFEVCLSESAHPVCYNGDLYTVEDYQNITSRFPGLSAVMIGRGLVSDPFLLSEIKNDGEVRCAPEEKQDKLMEFHGRLFEDYCREMAPKDAVFHLKEVWYYLARSFPGYEKEIRELLKAKKVSDYLAAAAHLRESII